ncbi:hypothetical protein HD806DRAFT_524439 [Xylariaceae sp. AK1471]|nr:hypothetical protein HD806DRAFT_524439 [Xylariaceae sp. AK1471]
MPLWVCDWEFCNKPAKDENEYYRRHVAPEERKISLLISRINGAVLCARSIALRDGINCTVDLSPSILKFRIGRQDCHAVVTFADGVEWITRFRMVDVSSPPPEVQDYVLCSEVATMEFVSSRISIQRSPNEVEMGSKVPFSMIGSLMHAPVVRDLAVQGMATLGANSLLGPFTSSYKAGEAIINSYLDIITSGRIANNTGVSDYLLHAYRLGALNSLFPVKTPGEKFYLKHPDDKDDHILVNSTSRVIDTFISLCMMWPTGPFYDGNNKLSKGEVDFTKAPEKKVNQKWRDYGSTWGPGIPKPMEGMINLSSGLRSAFDDERDEWKTCALKAFETDERLRS